MAGGKETPRQKMVGMMYLVLMAMLAINVSKSILDAFITTDEQGLEQNQRIVESINAIGQKISAGLLDDQSKKSAQEIMPIYKNLQKLSNTADDHFIKELNALFAETEKNPQWFKKDLKTQITKFESLEKMEKKDDYDTPSRLFGDGTPESDKRGKLLRLKLMDLRDAIILEIAGSLKIEGEVYTITKKELKTKEVFEKFLNNPKSKHPKSSTLLGIYDKLTKKEKIEQHHEKRDWNVARFYHQPMVGVVGTFTSLRNDIRLAQQEASKMLLNRMAKPMMVINKIDAQVLASTQYMNMGDKLDVQIGIVAYDSAAKYKIKYRKSESGDYIKSDSSSLVLNADSPGPKHIEGYLELEVAGVLEERPWSFDYTVGKPSASIASPELNVLYRSYSNRIQAVASGYPPDQVKVSCSGCSSFSKGKKGEYIAKVGGASKKATIKVTADGKTIGSQEFRVYPLPPAQPFFAGKTLGQKTIKAGLLRQAPPLKAKLLNSPLNVSYSVTSFDLEVIVKGKLIIEKGRGSVMSGKMKNMLKNVKKGQKVYFSNVMAKGPGGKSKPIGSLSFKVL